MTTGQRIAELRRQQNLSQEALGELLGVTRQSISKWESDAALPEVEKLVAMSRLFRISVGALLGVEEPAGEAEGAELTDAQLKMAEEIAGRYIAALSAPRKTAPAEIAIDEDADGELVARIRFDRNGEVRYCEVYMAEEMCESAMRDWVRCERKESAGEDEQVFRLNTVRGARRV